MESAAFVATCLHTLKVGEEASLGAKGTGMGLSGLIYSQDRRGASVLVIEEVALNRWCHGDHRARKR